MTVGAGVLAFTVATVTVAAGFGVSITSGAGTTEAFSVGGGGEGVSSSCPQAANSAINAAKRNDAALTFNVYILRSHY